MGNKSLLSKDLFMQYIALEPLRCQQSSNPIDQNRIRNTKYSYCITGRSFADKIFASVSVINTDN